METLEDVSVSSDTKLTELTRRLDLLEKQNNELQESMRYAGSLQQSILPNERNFKNVFTDAFVMFKPKDVVSGDFYWIAQYDNDVFFAVGDCTGHGIPGALLNIAGNTILRQVIRTEGVRDPAKIIELLDVELTSLFNDNRTIGETRDGMDIVLCRFDLESGIGSSCTAGRPLVMIRDGELYEIKNDSSSVGSSFGMSKMFETTEFNLNKGDQFYMFTDGYTDQFGGENVKKFNRKRFRNMLLALSEYELKKQKELLQLSFNNWKGTLEQIDDVCVVGISL